LDLAWQFPTTKPVKRRSSIGSFFHKIKKTVGATSSVVDADAEMHRESFTALVRELKGAFTKENYLVSITVLPNVNSSSKY
jgi:chitinase